MRGKMAVTAELEEEHRIIASVLPALERMADKLASGEFVRGYDVARVLEFLREFVDGCHMGKEERVLLLALEGQGVARESGMVAEFLEEHREARRCVRVMTAAMAEAIGEDPSAEADFAAYAREYVALLRRHMEKEDAELWSLAREVLPEDDEARLEDAYAEVEREMLGEGGCKRFREMAEEIG